MSITALKKRFIPLGSWSPDSPEFAPGFLDQIVNVIPVYGVYRTLQRLVTLGICPEFGRVTGTFVHRVSVDQSVDLMQPIYSEPASPVGLPAKEGFQPIPGQIQGQTFEFWQALRGLSPDAASTTVLFIPKTTERILYGYFDKGVKVWDAVNDMIGRYQYRISAGFVGTYDFTIEFGLPGDQNNPAEPALFTVLGSFNRAGDLANPADHTDGEYVVGSVAIANALFTDPGNEKIYAWRLRHTIQASTNEVALNPMHATTASFTNPSQIFGYRNEAGSSLPADIVASIQGLVAGVWTPTDLTAAVSSILTSSSPGGVGFYFRPDFPNFVNRSGHRMRLRFSVDSDSAQQVGVALFQGAKRSPDEVDKFMLQQWILGPGPPFITASFPTIMDVELTDIGINGELEKVTNWDDVWVFFFAFAPTQTGSIDTATYRPIADYSELGLWQHFPDPPPPAGFIAAISDGLDGTGMRSPFGSSTLPIPFVQARMAQELGSGANFTSVRACIRAANESLMNPVFVRLYLVSPTGDGISQGWVSQIILIPPGATALADYKASVDLSRLPDLRNVTMRVEIQSQSTGIFDLADFWYEVDSGVRVVARLHDFAYYGPREGDAGAAAPIDVSWLRLDGPALVSDIQQDSIKAYIGTVEVPASATQVGKIWEVQSPSFSTWFDASKAAHYFSNKRDKSWSFTNFGSIVVATNYADPVQAKYESDALFKDLIGFDPAGVAIPNYVVDGGVYPRARFAATINAFLCLANCDPLSVVGTAQPYSFWCSRYAQPQYFHIGLTEWQSSVFQLVSTPGEITGMVGGEYGLIFKENSVWRADYVGLPQIFNFTQLSGEQGTVQPRSIVKVDNDVYFWGIGGIYVVRDGRELQELAGQGSVRKFIFDSQFEAFSISNSVPSLESQATSRVIGGYDTYTGCILWSYITEKSKDNWFKNDSMLVYSPRENRFTFLRGDSLNEYLGTSRIVSASDLFSTNSLQNMGFLSLGNRVTSGETYLMKTILALSGDLPQIQAFSGRGQDAPTYEQFYRSNTIAGSFFGAPVGVEIELQKVRAILAVENIEKAPDFKIWIEANQSPAVGDETGRVLSVDSSRVNAEGWIDLGTPLSGEFFKFGLVFKEYTDPIVKEVHGWQVVYRIAGDR